MFLGRSHDKVMLSWWKETREGEPRKGLRGERKPPEAPGYSQGTLWTKG